MENTLDMDVLMDEVVKKVGKTESSRIVTEYLSFIQQFEDTAEEEMKHEHVQVLIQDIEALQKDPGIEETLKKAFPDKTGNEPKLKNLMDRVMALTFQETKFFEPDKEEEFICLLTLLANKYSQFKKGEKALPKRISIHKYLRAIQMIKNSQDLYLEDFPNCFSKTEGIHLLEKIRVMGFIEGLLAAKDEMLSDESLQKIIHSYVAAKTVRKGRWDVTNEIAKGLVGIATRKWEKGDTTYHNNMADYLLEVIFDELVFDKDDKKPKKDFKESGLSKEEEDTLRVRNLLKEIRSEHSDKKIASTLPCRTAMISALRPSAKKFGCLRGVKNKKSK